MLNIHLIIDLVASGLEGGIFLLFIIASYYTPNQKNERIIYLSFSLFCLTITIFVFTQAMIYNSLSFNEGLFWHRFQHIGAVWIPSTFIHFTYAITRSNNKKIIYSAYLISLVFFFFTFSDSFILPSPNLNTYFGFEGKGGPIYNIFALFVVYGIITGERKLFGNMKHSNDQSLKNILKYIIISTGILAITGIMGLLFVLEIVPYYLLVDIEFVAFCLSIAVIIGVDIQYFKAKAEYHEKRIIIDRLDTTRHVVRLFLHDIRHILASFRLYLYHHKNGKLKNPQHKYDRLMDRFRQCEVFLKDVLSPEFTDYVLKETDIVSFVDKVVDNFISGQTENIEVFKSYPDNSIIAEIDSKKIERVIEVILTNAYDAMDAPGKLDVIIEKYRDTVYIKIQDTGIGMTDEELENIGRPRFSTKEDKGEGLGLFTSIAVVQQHKGSIKVESKKGEGSIFTIELPVYKAADKKTELIQRKKWERVGAGEVSA